jgi:hypothetical protein
MRSNRSVIGTDNRATNNSGMNESMAANSRTYKENGLLEDNFDPNKVEKITSKECYLCKASFGWFKGKSLKNGRKHCSKCGHNVCNLCMESTKVRLSNQD